MSEYISKAKTTNIHYVSRVSLKIDDNFYTMEYGEDRTVDFDNVDIDKEIRALIDKCNVIVDTEARNTFKEISKKYI